MGFDKRNLLEIADSAAKFGFGHVGEARFPNEELHTQQTGLSLHTIKPNQRQAFGHRHAEVEEVYVILRGSGRAKLDDEIVEVGERDAVRVDAQTWRCFEAGPDGLELLAVSPRRKDDRGEMEVGWWKD
ncbi:MAG TPA: cupin domain-containing protein [Solirubrobacterales bacterium]|jgi:mannose-6-phosphate isomerase-like protein (cupin superfamily)